MPLAPSRVKALETAGGPGWTLVRGDCLPYLRALSAGAVQHVITDPPFGIALTCHSPDLNTDGRARRRKRGWGIANDHDTNAAEEVFAWADERGLPLVAFGSPYRPYPGEWRNILAWDKGEAVGGGGDPTVRWKRTFELIYTRRNGALAEGRDGAVLRFPVTCGPDFALHPCQKPVRLLRYLVRQLTRPGDVVCDPFCGSGSTGAACLMEGRKFLGVELDPAHADVAERRLTELSECLRRGIKPKGA